MNQLQTKYQMFVKKILSETPLDDRYKFGKTTFFNLELIEKYKEEFKSFV